MPATQHIPAEFLPPATRVHREASDEARHEATVHLTGEDLNIASDIHRPGRFSAHYGGYSAEIVGTVGDGAYVIYHTGVDPALRGRGVGHALVRYAVEWARDNDLTVVPFCPFANALLRHSPEWARGASIDFPY